MEHARRTLIPVPTGRQQQPGQPAPAPSPQQPIIELQVLETAEQPLRVLSAQPRSVAPLAPQQPYRWPAPFALGVQVINTLDAALLVDVGVNMQPSNADTYAPVVQFDVGPRESRSPSIDPGAGDPWGPHVLLRVTPQAAPTAGGVDVWIVRKGGVAP